MNFSAKQLLTSSCMQLKYLRDNPQKKAEVSVGKLEGVKEQHKMLSKFNAFGEELGGVYKKDDITIFFSNDIVSLDKIIEVKTINGKTEDWYFNNSVLQCALYSSFIRLGSTMLTTSKFFLAEGNPKRSIVVKRDIDYLLLFGDKLYKVVVTNPKQIVDFFINKAKATFEYETAKVFDKQYKFKEFETLKKYFKIENCNEEEKAQNKGRKLRTYIN